MIAFSISLPKELLNQRSSHCVLIIMCAQNSLIHQLQHVLLSSYVDKVNNSLLKVTPLILLGH